VAQICCRLDGIPLAIELAAARLRTLSLDEILRRLDDRFHLLTGGSRTALPRQQTLKALIDWSYDLLSQAEQALFRRLAVFAGGWTLAGAEAVCADAPAVSRQQAAGSSQESDRTGLTADRCILTAEVLDLLPSLVDKSLVLYEEQDERYRMLETVRQYARDRLEESGEAAAARDRLLAYCLRLAEEAEPELTGPGQAACLQRLQSEHDNLRAAMEWSVSRDEGGRMRDECPDSDRIHPSSLIPHPSEIPLRLAAALEQFWFVRGYIEEGRRSVEAALAQGGPAPGLPRARALQVAGFLAHLQADYPVANAHYAESLRIHRDLGNARGVAELICAQGDTARAQGNIERARALLAAARQRFHEFGHLPGRAFAVWTLAGVHFLQDDYTTAGRLFHESLDLYRQLGDPRGISLALASLGNLLIEQGQFDLAITLLDQSLALCHELQDRRHTAHVLSGLGRVAAYQDRHDAALAYLEECLALQWEVGDREGILLTLSEMGRVTRHQGDYARSNEILQEHLRLCRQWQLRVPRALDDLARLAYARGEEGRAAVLFAASDAARQARGWSRRPVDQADYERYLAELRQGMGEVAFAAAAREGHAMSVEQAVEYAGEAALSWRDAVG
jgi:non-specific serine/threonine protein kinase